MSPTWRDSEVADMGLTGPYPSHIGEGVNATTVRGQG